MRRVDKGLRILATGIPNLLRKPRKEQVAELWKIRDKLEEVGDELDPAWRRFVEATSELIEALIELQ